MENEMEAGFIYGFSGIEHLDKGIIPYIILVIRGPNMMQGLQGLVP